MKHLQVGFYSYGNYFDINAFSGALYHMHQALKTIKEIDVIDLGNPKKNNLWSKLRKRIWSTKKPPAIGSKRFIEISKRFNSKVQSQLLKTPCDVIFAPVASHALMYLETNVPIIYFSDSTSILNRRYYEPDQSQEKFEWKQKAEYSAISKSSRLVYASEWAANSAIYDYQADPSKIDIIPFAANVDNVPSLSELLPKKQVSSPCRLLFAGKDWNRKGGDIAVQTLISLLKMGVDAELVIIGGGPPTEIKHEKITVIPFLNKNNPQQRKLYYELFSQSHFFILPTRAECQACANCEANAFATPSITTEVGGIPTIIKNGKNGYMLPLSASGDDFAKLIAEIFSDKIRYEHLVRSSREEYDSHLNFDAWAKSIHKVIINMMKQEVGTLV